MLPGIVIKRLNRLYDERGSFVEVMRRDWPDIFPGRSVQANMSISYPGIVRAWHKHERGQVDCFLVARGALKICAWDDETQELDEIVSSGDAPQVVRVPGHYWHGFSVVGDEPAMLVYFVNRVYDYKSPDEVRRPWDDPAIVPTSVNGKTGDTRGGRPWDWFWPPHK